MLVPKHWEARLMAGACLQGLVRGGGPYLHPSLGQVGAHGQSLAHHHIRVVSLLEGLFQGLKLLSSERRAAATLFAVLGAITGLQDDVLKCTAVGGQGEGAHLIMGNSI